MADPIARLVAAVNEISRGTIGRVRVGVSHDDADPTAGSFASDDAIGFDPIPLLRALDATGARAVVMGQVAGIMHGSQELTGDLDLLWDGDPTSASAFADAFISLEADLADANGQEIPCTSEAFELPKVLFRTQSASGDCCTPELPWADLDIIGTIARAEVARAPDGLTIRYVAAPDLITMRLAVGRPKDLRRADELRLLFRQP